MKKNYQLAFVDLDDTLLGPDKSISPENLAALQQLRAEGVQIVITSGRHHNNILSFHKIGPPDWIISSQGAVVRNVPTGETLLETSMDPAMALAMCRRGQALGLSIVVYNREAAFIEEKTRWTEVYHQKAGWAPLLGSFPELAQGGLQKVFWSEDPARITELAGPTIAEFSDRLYVVETNPELLEFLAFGINKAGAAAMLAEYLSVPAERTLAFGDGNNDVELLHWAGLSVAMSHGREGAKKAAKLVSPDGPPGSAFARAVGLVLA